MGGDEAAPPDPSPGWGGMSPHSAPPGVGAWALLLGTLTKESCVKMTPSSLKVSSSCVC